MEVRVVTPHGAFDEIAEMLRCGLKTLTGLPDRTLIIGAHLLPWGERLPSNCVLYNFEQRESPLLNSQVLDLFQGHEVWDYSASNVAWLAQHGIRAKHVPIGFVPEMRRIIPALWPDIDVLFYGLVNTRRRRILDDLKAAGLKVHEVVNCYGHERDELIARSKVVLNMHFYETHIFEIVRCSYLFTNEICVVSEKSIDVPRELEHAVPFAPYGPLLVEACVRLVRNRAAANQWATRAHKAFRVCDEKSILRSALRGV